MIARHSRVLGAAVAALLAATFLPSTASAATPPSGISLDGHGRGHGHGMSQYGAAGAANQGKTYPQILAFYYPGTTLSSTTRNVRVKITEAGNILRVKSRAGLTAHWQGHTNTWDLAKRQPAADFWQIYPYKFKYSQLQFHTSTGWHAFTTLEGVFQFNAAGAPITTLVGSRGIAYRGVVAATIPYPTSSNERTIVNTLSLEAYLYGVVPREMPASWPAEALRAQSVAARTYAAYEINHAPSPRFDVYDDTSSQVYGGYSAEVAATNAAVTATAKRILAYQGAPAFTQFASSNGGYELAGSQPYLVSQADPYDPKRPWTGTRTAAEVLKLCPSASGALTSVRVAAYVTGAGHWVSTVRIAGSTGTPCSIAGTTFRSGLGLPSQNIDTITFTY